MNILMVSLLRVGDIFMITPIVKRLKRLHPNAKIHLLMNSEFQYVIDVLSDIDEFIFFPRNQLQQMCSISEMNVTQPLDVIEQMVVEINEIGFDKVLNLTHNKLSAHLMSLIDCENKIGVSYDKLNHSKEDSRWFDFLNDRFYFEDRPPFHYVDAFYQGSGSDGPIENGELAISEASVAFAQKQIVTAGETIFFQLTSSDEKKNWSVDSVKKCLAELKQKGRDLAIICAPGEEQTISEMLPTTDIPVFPVSFSHALALIRRGNCLVTLDTSVKHLAASSGVPIIELALGSSNPYETGVRGKDHYIVQSKEYCVPCKHSEDCHREKRFCESGVDPLWMSEFIDNVFRRDDSGVVKLSAEVEASLTVLKTAADPFGMWVAFPCSALGDWRREFSWLLRRSAYQHLLLSHRQPQFAKLSSDWILSIFDRLTVHVGASNRLNELERLQMDRRTVWKAAEKILNECRIGPSFPPTLSLQEQMTRFHSAMKEFERVEHSTAILKIFNACLESAVEGSFMTLKRVREFMRQLSEMSSWEMSLIGDLIVQEESDVGRIGESIETSIGKTERSQREDRGFSKVRGQDTQLNFIGRNGQGAGSA